MVNADRAAKLEWRSYGKFTAVPEGSVAVVDDTSGRGHAFVGRYLDPDPNKYQFGAIGVHMASYAFDSMTVLGDNGDVKEVNNGEVFKSFIKSKLEFCSLVTKRVVHYKPPPSN